MVAARRRHPGLAGVMALASRLGLAAALAVSLPAAAQEPPPETPDAGAPPPAPAQLEPPRALVDTTVPYPADAPPQPGPIAVRVKLLVGADGTVHKVELL